MAYRQTYRINPIDIGQPMGIGINVLFNNGTDIFNTTTTTRDQIKSNLINFLLTNKGERLNDPEFGGDIKRAIFEQADFESFDIITGKLENEIVSNIPGIVLQSVTAEPNPDFNIVTITITYQINQENDSLVLNVETNNLNTF
jgi:phage baseplate assembly protein W